MYKRTILSFRSLKPISFLISVFGLSPLSYVQLFSSTCVLRELPESPSKTSRLYGFILGLMITYLNLLTFYETVSKEYGRNVTFSYLLTAANLLFLTSSSLTYAQSCSSKYSRTRRMLIELDEVDWILRQRPQQWCKHEYNQGGVGIEYRHDAGAFIRKTVMVIALHVVMYAMDVYNFYHSQLNQLLGRSISHFVMTANLLEFCSFIQLLTDRFSTVNSLLEETLRRKNNSQPSGKTDITRYPAYFIHNRQCRLQGRSGRMNDLVALRLVHYRLHCIASRNMQVMFGAHLLGEVVLVFVAMMLTAHSFVNQTFGAVFGISMVCVCFCAAVRFLIVALVCEGLAAEARRTAEVLATPVLMECVHDAGDEETLFRQVILFSRQMEDCGSLQFKVLGGVFVVDAQLLVAIIGTIVTYLVVLQQI